MLFVPLQQVLILTFIGELVKAAESVNLVIAYIGNGCVDQTGGFCANRGYELRFVAFSGRLAVPDGAGSHNESVVCRAAGGRRGYEGGGWRVGRGGQIARKERDRRVRWLRHCTHRLMKAGIECS